MIASTRAVLEYVVANPGCSTNAISDEFCFTTTQALNRLNGLYCQRLIGRQVALLRNGPTLWFPEVKGCRLVESLAL